MNQRASNDEEAGVPTAVGTMPDRPALRARVDSKPVLKAPIAEGEAGQAAEAQTVADPSPSEEKRLWTETITQTVARPAPLETRELGTHVGRAQLSRLPPIAKFGRYDLLGRLAYGGMAEIFLAREREVGTGTDRFLVVKRVLPHVAADEQFVEMFLNEARLAMQLSHPNICHVYTFGQEQGAYFLAMEWVNGSTLSRILRRTKAQRFPMHVVLKIIAQIAEALDHAHRASDANGEPLGIVHRDVSPQNIMVSYDGVVKLLDFGIAKATTHSTRTEAGVIKGKYSYMSPQQCVGEPVDARADIYALGICLYEALSGENPFRKATEYDTMRALVFDDAPELPNVPANVQAIVQKSLKKRVEERYSSAAEMHADLEAAIAATGNVVTATKIADAMAEVFGKDIRSGPKLDTQPDGIRLERPNDSDANHTSLLPEAHSQETSTDAERKQRRAYLIALSTAITLGALLIAVVAVGYYVFARPTTRTTQLTRGPQNQSVSTTQTPGALVFTTDPPGADVWLDGRSRGQAPAQLTQLTPGMHHLLARKRGYRAWEVEVMVSAGRATPVFAALLREPRIPAPVVVAGPTRAETPSDGTNPDRRLATQSPAVADRALLSINTRPWSRVVVVMGNGQERVLGTTPLGRIPVPAGTLMLRMVDRDGHTHTETVTTEDGQHRTAFFSFEAPNPETTPGHP